MGSRLLIEARGGDLRTRLYRRKHDINVPDTLCSACRDAEEIINLLPHCPALVPAPGAGISNKLALGFTGELSYLMCSKWRLEDRWIIHKCLSGMGHTSFLKVFISFILFLFLLACLFDRLSI